MRLALTALATLFFFGCETVQVRTGPPLAAPAPPPPRVALAAPYVDLWMEGAGGVTPQESDEGFKRARAALGAALDGRGFVPEQEADQVLVVQAQGVARTDGRRSQQVAATVGIVLVIAAVVVLIVTSSRSGSRAPSRAPGARAAPAPPRGSSYAAPRGYYAPPAPWFGWNFGVGMSFHGPMAGPPPWPPVAVPSLEARLPARGFWAGDETEIVLELRDARTGATTWVRRTHGEVDPRDAPAVRALLDRAISDQPWAHGPPPPASAPEVPRPPPAAPGTPPPPAPAAKPSAALG